MPVWKITKIKAPLSSIFDFLFFLSSAQINSIILNFYSWNLPITGTINRVAGVREDSSAERIQPAPLLQTKLSRKKRYWIPRSVWLSSITFIFYNNPTLNNCFHINQKINQLINNQMEKELFKLSWLNWVTSHSSCEASKLKTFRTNR